MSKKATIIAVVNQKGGTGKTTTTENLGVGLALEGKKVLLVDTDPQASLTVSLGNPCPDELSPTLSDLMGKIMVESPIAPGEGILHHPEGVDLVPSNIELSGMEVALVNAMSRETILQQYLDTVKQNYDYILLDCMPSLGMLTVNALAAADNVLIPVQAAYLPAKGLEQLLGTINKVKRQINPKLRIEGILLTINLAFSCSLRMGELLGLTWDCIDISPTSIELGQASIFVEKELQRVNREAMADLDGKDIMFKFPPTFASTHTALVLKTPKTKTSVRKVFLPKTVAEMLVQRKADIEELKDLFGDEFVDFNLVFCSSNGKPIEGQVINRAFNKLIEEKGLPKVVFHSLRHSSITYKLKLNGGDMKSVQGDSGHAQVKMVADVYSHIIDDDRRLNAERMEAAFYSGRQATPEPVQPAATESSADDKELLLKLLQNPEMAALLKSLAKTL